MNSLPRLADILANLRTLHENDNTPCPGPSNCPLLAIMGDVESLMDDVAKDQGEQDPEFQAADLLPEEPDTTAIADAIIRAQSNPAAKFMPAARLCVECDNTLPETLSLTVNRCENCRASL